jgi:HrpA-like RNA helicase
MDEGKRVKIIALSIDFSLVIVWHLFAEEGEGGFNFKLVLMSATFNVELFASYFSKPLVKEIEDPDVYVGVEEKEKREEEERKAKLA